MGRARRNQRDAIRKQRAKKRKKGQGSDDDDDSDGDDFDYQQLQSSMRSNNSGGIKINKTTSLLQRENGDDGSKKTKDGEVSASVNPEGKGTKKSDDHDKQSSSIVNK